MRPRPSLLFVAVLVVAALGWAWRAGAPRFPDLQQDRLDTALPLLTDGVTARQPFTAQHNGLQQVTVQVARYDGVSEGTLWLWVEDADGTRLADEQFADSALQANQSLTLTFAPQATSAGQRYVVGAAGDGPPRSSLWGYSLALLDEPIQISGATSAAQSLRLTTRYELSPTDALLRTGSLIRRDLRTSTLALIFLLAPGALLLSLLPRGPHPRDLATWLALAVALGLALWPLLWQATTLLGLRWSGRALWVATLLMAAGALWRGPRSVPRPRRTDALLALILLGAYSVRLLATGDLAFLPWVDSVRHATIATVMAERGQTMRDYAPLLPEVTRFPYHFGFHVLPASLMLMGAGAVTPLLLALHALLNALFGLAIHAAARLMTGRARVGLIAAFLVSFPFLFPGYYATWGRLTQLAGLLVLAPLAGLTWRLLRGGPGWRGAWPLVGLLMAGLFLVHVRVFLFYLPLPVLLWLAGRGRRTRPLLAAALLGALLITPRALDLATIPSARVGSGTSAASYHAIPWQYFVAGWERAWPIAAALMAVMALLVALHTPRGRQRAAMPLLVALWWGLLLIAAVLPDAFPRTGIVNANSVVIALCLPLALLLGWGAGQGWHHLARWPSLRAMITGLLIGLLLAFGVRQQLTILNEQTILARPADAEALAWATTHIPPEARVAVNAWSWLNGVWSGSDGGAWLLPVTRHASTTPPADYAYSAALTEQVVAFNEWADEIRDWSTPEAAAWLRAQGVTHLYVGARGGFLDPAQLARNPALELLYAKDGTLWFALR